MAAVLPQPSAPPPAGVMTSRPGRPDNGRGRDQHVVLTSADSRGFVSLRRRVPRSALGEWSAPDSRADPVQQIIATHEGRLDRLIPVRIGRMITSPYAFLRGAAAIMAEDFAHLPATGITPVICGDAHLGNFGFYASPSVISSSTSTTSTRHTRGPGSGICVDW